MSDLHSMKNHSTLDLTEQYKQTVGGVVALICWRLLEALAALAPLIIIMVFLITAITKHNYQTSCYQIFNQLMEQRGVDYYQMIEMWRTEYPDAPFPSEFGGWYVAGHALVAAFSALMIMLAAGCILCLLVFVATCLHHSHSDQESDH